MPTTARRGLVEAGLVFLALAGAVLAVYASVLDAPFVFDDHAQLLQNRAIRLRELSWQGLWTAVAESPSRRPVASLSFALNYLAGGYTTRGYHAVNLLLHAANAWLVYALMRAALRRRGPTGAPAEVLRLVPGLAALLFALHPLQTQSVSYVVQRMNLLCAFFYLLALGFHVLARERPPGRRAWLWAGCASSGLLALGAKQNAITLPAAIFLWEWFFYRGLDPHFARRVLRRAGPPLAALGLWTWWWIFQGPSWGFNAKPFTLWERLLSQGRVIALYAGLAALPLPSRLDLLHDLPPSRSLLVPLSTLPALLAVLGAAALSIRSAARWPWPCFALLWFLLHLAVESSILPLDLVYEHRTYLPLAGVCMAAAVGLARLSRGRALRLALLSGPLLLLLASWTAERNRVWADPVALWSDVVAKNPANPLARSDLAAALAASGRVDLAIEESQRALALDPDSARVHANLGMAYALLGRFPEAAEHFERALQSWPDDADLHTRLGAALVQGGDRERARAHLERAVALDPRSGRAFYNLGLLALEGGDPGRAEGELRRAVALEPDSAEAWQALGRASEERGDLNAAELQYREALQREPSPSSRARLGWVLALLGRDREARDELGAALAGDERMALARARLAWLEATSRDPQVFAPESARRRAERALQELGSGNPRALEALAAAEAALGHRERAAVLAREAAARAEARGEVELAGALRERALRYEAGAEASVVPGR